MLLYSVCLLTASNLMKVIETLNNVLNKQNALTESNYMKKFVSIFKRGAFQMLSLKTNMFDITDKELHDKWVYIILLFTIIAYLHLYSQSLLFLLSFQK